MQTDTGSIILLTHIKYLFSEQNLAFLRSLFPLILLNSPHSPFLGWFYQDVLKDVLIL